MTQKRKHIPPNSLQFILDNKDLDEYLYKLRLGLVRGGYISSNMRATKFRKLFTNGKYKVKAIWKGNVSELKYFVQELKKMNIIASNHVLWEVIVNCIEVEGKQITVKSLRKTGFPSKNRRAKIDSILLSLKKHSDLKKNLREKTPGILSLSEES